MFSFIGSKFTMSSAIPVMPGIPMKIESIFFWKMSLCCQYFPLRRICSVSLPLTYVHFLSVKVTFADFLTEILNFITVWYTIGNLTLYINFFFYWLSLLQLGGISEVFEVGKETEKFANTSPPLVIFGLNWNKYESYSLKMSSVWWLNDFFIICVSFKVGIWYWKEIMIDYWKLSLIVSMFLYWCNLKFAGSKT